MFHPRIRGWLRYYGRCAGIYGGRHIRLRAFHGVIRSCSLTGRWACGLAPWREPYGLRGSFPGATHRKICRSGVGRCPERKFLGFRLAATTRIGIAPESIERCKGKVREMREARQSRTSTELRDAWKRCMEGWRSGHTSDWPNNGKNIFDN